MNELYYLANLPNSYFYSIKNHRFIRLDETHEITQSEKNYHNSVSKISENCEICFCPYMARNMNGTGKSNNQAQLILLENQITKLN